MSTENDSSPKTPFGDRLAMAFVTLVRAVVRLIIILVVLAALGLGLFYGLPWVYDQYVRPVEENSMRLDEIETYQEQVNAQLTQNAADMQKRLATLEAQNKASGDTVAALQAQLAEAKSTLQAGLDDTGTSLTASLEQLDALQTALTELDTRIAELQLSVVENSTGLETLSADYYVQGSPISALHRDLQLVKAMELLTRSRISIYQNNLGLARQDIQAARDLLAELQPLIPSYQVDTLEEILARMALALRNLDETPGLAAEDLEVAWQLLVIGFPGDPLYEPSGALDQTPEITRTPIATTKPQLTPTPAPERTTNPTSTPIPYPSP